MHTLKAMLVEQTYGKNDEVVYKVVNEYQHCCCGRKSSAILYVIHVLAYVAKSKG